MKEQMYYNKLTPAQEISYARKGGNKMTDGGVEVQEQKTAPKTEAKKQENKKAVSENEAKLPLTKQEAALKAWNEHYKGQGKTIFQLHPTEQQTVWMAVREGWKPQAQEVEAEKPEIVDARGRVKPEIQDVLEASRLSDNERLAKAEKVLREKKLLKEGESLSDEQQKAILKAHYFKGTGIGKSGGDSTSGVYNYSREQLREKTIILQTGLTNEELHTFSKDERHALKENWLFNEEQRRALIEAGIAAEPVVPPAGVIPPALQNIINQINNRATALGPDRPYDQGFLHDRVRDIEALVSAGIITDEQAVGILGQLSVFISEVSSREERVGWQLMRSDRTMLDGGEKKITEWLETQLDQMYILAEKGQEATGQQIQHMQGRLGEATTYVINKYNLEEKAHGPYFGTERARVLFDIFNTRLNVLFLKTAIERRNDEQMVGAAMSARTEGIAKIMMLDGGKVQFFFNRMNELLEDMRLREGGLEHTISPEMMERLSHMVKDEQYELAKKGLGNYAEKYRESRDKVISFHTGQGTHPSDIGDDQTENEIRELTKKAMVRTERAALDLLVVLQRVSILNARGDLQRGADLRRTVPGGGLPFGFIKYIVGPGQKLTAEGEQVFDEMLIYMADDHLRAKGVKKPNSIDKLVRKELDIHKLVRKELGERLFGVIYEPADFFSSGWRCNSLMKQIGEYIEYKYALRALGVTDEKDTSTVTAEQIAAQKAICRDAARDTAKDFALFIQVKRAFGDGDRLDRDDKKYREKKKEVEDIWGKIATYRPEEIMRLYRDRAAGEQAFINIFNSEPFSNNIPLDGIVYRNLHGVSNSQQEATYRYDRFKQKYGFIMGVIRDRAFKEPIPRQVNVAALNAEEQALINNFLGAGEAEKVMAMHRAMQDGINRNEDGRVNAWLRPGKTHRSMIEALVDDSRFADIYRHTLIVDDTLFGQLEMVNLDPHVTGIIPISKVLANEPGADALVRNFMDIKDANAAQNGLLMFLDNPDAEEKLKALKAAGDAVYSMNGADTRVAMYDAALGTFLELSKQAWFWDMLRVGKLPFQLPSSKLERILGPHAQPTDATKRLAIINQFRNQLTLHASEETPEDKLLPFEERAKKIEERKEKAEKVVNKLRKIAAVTAWNMVKLKISTGFFYFLIAIIAEAFSMLNEEAGVKK